jgi:[histone H3]-lysine4 N-trimethyltransferase ASH1L
MRYVSSPGCWESDGNQCETNAGGQQCYYLMSFDQNMIIDATTGSIARFVNHSCSPNCRMIKWIVAGQPRMALFAGDRPIMSGEELTYDYNFDPFSAKNVQKCLCGAPNCRGVLGPKPKEVKPPKPAKEEAGKKKGSVKGSVKAGKRKLKELLSNDRDGDSKATKKRKMATATGVVTAKTITAKTAKGKSTVVAKGKGKVVAAKMATKGAATAIKRSVSKVSVKAKTALSKKTASRYVVRRGTKTTSTTKMQTKLSWSSSTKAKKSVPSSPASASSTIVAAPAKLSKASPSKKTTERGSAKSTPASKAAGPLSATATKEASARKRTPSRKLLESATSSAAPSPASGKSKAAVDLSRPSKIRLVQESVYDFPS